MGRLPEATLEDFFRHQLSVSIKEEKPIALEWQLLPDIKEQLVKTDKFLFD